ncbi:hypothetical protein, partial [Tannerella sp.]|uniref:hypothetical protein n=1 Tax=Tannerella sp. TaxID=2382127 RepID=UPI0026DBDE2C
INNSTNKHFNNSTPAGHTRAEGLNEIHAYFFYCGIWVAQRAEGHADMGKPIGHAGIWQIFPCFLLLCFDR